MSDTPEIEAVDAANIGLEHFSKANELVADEDRDGTGRPNVGPLNRALVRLYGTEAKLGAKQRNVLWDALVAAAPPPAAPEEDEAEAPGLPEDGRTTICILAAPCDPFVGTVNGKRFSFDLNKTYRNVSADIATVIANTAGANVMIAVPMEQE